MILVPSPRQPLNGNKMNHFLKNTVLVVSLVFMNQITNAQQFRTHAVKEGETLESIAKQYRVTPYNILKLNKELKQHEELRPNTILVIPVGAVADKSSSRKTSDIKKLFPEVDSVERQKPFGFKRHKVRRKETLYGLTKRYNITEEELKRYNRELYSSQLRKKMILRIPIFQEQKKRTERDSILETNFEIYTVAPKETRWSIAHKYGITIDSMLVLNPDLSKITDYLREGQQLRLPKLPGSTTENQETELYISYTVPPKMNFYRLEQEFGVKSDEIVRLNPEIAERGGLKEGMIIRLPEKKLDPGAINTENYIFYEVKPKQTLFSLTRKLGISYGDLLLLNPDLKEGLKAGMVLKLPNDQKGDFEVRNALVLDKINLLDSINLDNRPKLLFLLPFRLDRLNLRDKESVEVNMEKRNDVKLSLGLYSGALVALDSIAELGVSVDVRTYDNQLNLARTKEVLFRENLLDVDAVVGPLDEQSLKEVAVRTAVHGIPVIAPVPVKSDISLNNVFFSYTSDEILRKRMLQHVADSLTGQNIVVIADQKNSVARDSIVAKFPTAKILEVAEEEKNIGINRGNLATMLSEEVDNWVFLETGNFKLISSVVSILNSFNDALLDTENSTEKLKLRLFTTNKNRAFENDVISSSHLSKLRFTYPSVYREVANDNFVKRYRKRFGDAPDRYAVRGFDITYDLLLKLAYKNNLMEASKLIGKTEYTGNTFDYEKDFASGYFNRASYIMTYDNLRIKEVN